jgi:predicted nucleotidyltransferase
LIEKSFSGAEFSGKIARGFVSTGFAVKSEAFCATKCIMKRDEIIERLKEREADLRAQGVAHAALFGSVARGDDRPDSDIDILVDLDPAIVVTIFDYAGVKEFIAGMFDRPVDVVSRESLKPRVRPKATADAIYAF